MEVYWNAVGTSGLEHLTLSQRNHAIWADGLVLRHHNGIGVRLRYQVICSSDWTPIGVVVQSWDKRVVSLHSTGNGVWRDSEGMVLENLTGCETVDVMATPFTNTLAINQLKLLPGQSGDIQAVFITIPDLWIERSAQRYTRLDDNGSYLYENLDTGFSAKLWVDSHNLVKMYSGVWERLF